MVPHTISLGQGDDDFISPWDKLDLLSGGYTKFTFEFFPRQIILFFLGSSKDAILGGP